MAPFHESPSPRNQGIDQIAAQTNQLTIPLMGDSVTLSSDELRSTWSTLFSYFIELAEIQPAKANELDKDIIKSSIEGGLRKIDMILISRGLDEYFDFLIFQGELRLQAREHKQDIAKDLIQKASYAIKLGGTINEKTGQLLARLIKDFGSDT